MKLKKFFLKNQVLILVFLNNLISIYILIKIKKEKHTCKDEKVVEVINKITESFKKNI